MAHGDYWIASETIPVTKLPSSDDISYFAGSIRGDGHMEKYYITHTGLLSRDSSGASYLVSIDSAASTSEDRLIQIFEAAIDAVCKVES